MINIEISVLASGSNGNACLVEDKQTSVLIDAGKSGKELIKRASRLNKSLETLSGILLTHGHSDHIQSAGILSRKFGTPIYMTPGMYADIKFKLGKINYKLFNHNTKFKINTLTIEPVKTSHNIDSSGYVIENFGLFTDTGKITSHIEKVLPKLKTILLESNHDIDTLIKGPYPYHLKQWILSDKGHLSNFDAAQLINKYGSNLDLVLLGHLSGTNNTSELTKHTFETLVKHKLNYEICSRHSVTGSF